jgi:hypothetical protein
MIPRETYADDFDTENAGGNVVGGFVPRVPEKLAH